MKTLSIASLAALVFALPLAASAHQVAVYDIGGERYQIVIGSLNEPVAIDDNSGVDLRVTMPGHENMPANDHHGEGGAVIGLENTLKVELIAGDKKKVLDLSPKHGEQGVYYAKFFPTVATTISYRIFGTINETPVDLTYVCRAEGAEAVEEGEKAISEGVKQVSRRGGFGCFADKAALGFPEESAPVVAVNTRAANADGKSMVALALSCVALVFAGVATRRRS